MLRRSSAALSGVLLLAACSGGIVPRIVPPGSAPAASSKPARPPSPAPKSPSQPSPAARTASATTAAPRPQFQTVAPPAAAIAAKANAASTGVRAGPAIDTLPVTDTDATRALAAFRTSCPSIIKRNDQSGLTSGADWQAACAAAAQWPADSARDFFNRYFETAIIGDGNAYVTGYYEPEIRGSRSPSAEYPVPIYRRPPDLIDVDLGQFSQTLAGKKISGRFDGKTLVPYADRSAIVDQGALANRGLELGWAADDIEFFFLQVQGSGRLRLPDGSVIRIGYAGQNGRDYTGIGKLMRDRGLIGPDQSSMQGVIAWLRAHPAEGHAIMNENKSFVFFRELTGDGAIGALGYPVTPRGSLAADPAFTPLGAPVWLWLDRTEASGLWVAQDTGGAIKGANRYDSFWGPGADAAVIAGGMSGRGQAYVLLPTGTVARLTGGTPVVAPAGH